MRIKGVFISAILAAVLGVSNSVLAVLSGDGTQGTPYLIQSRADFDEFANPANAVLYWASGKYTTLMCDIDLANTPYSQAVIAPNFSTTFAGNFDGKWHTLSKLTITASTEDYVGLFGCVSSSGQIKNLRLKNVFISGRDSVGGLVGANYGTLISCYATGSVSGNDEVGGLVGANSGTLISCYATGSVSGTGYYVGGLVGFNQRLLTSCYATGSVNGSFDVGGLVGQNNGTLISCYATGSVSGNDDVGGLVGENIYGTLTSCFWDKQTSGKTVGVGHGPSTGVMGKTTAEMKTLSTFTSAGWDFVGESVDGLNDYWQMGINDYPRFTIHLWTLEGEGTSANPYIVANAVDLGKVWSRPSACYRLGDNLDLAGISWSSAVIPAFSGVFDGNNNTIRNADFKLPSGQYIGLFGTVVSVGQICNLGVENVTITGGIYVGGLVGDNDGTLTSCYATGAVSGTGYYYVGGLVGENNGTLTSCYATGSVNGTDYVGGLVGGNNGTLTSCYATGAVNGTDYVGGLVGVNDYGTLTSCYATGSATGTGRCIGGLVGWNDGSLISCYATGAVNGNSIVGGLVGDNSCFDDYYFGTLTSCYATGSVSGNDDVGGLVGDNSGLLTSCFWDERTSGKTVGVGSGSSAGVMGKTTAEMKTPSTFTSAGWDFVGESIHGLNDYWQMGINDYPRFTIHLWTLEGEGTSANPYIVANAVDLGKVWLRPSACYRLGDNLDLAGISWSSAAVPVFAGVFDGNNNTIRNADFNLPGGQYIGLFGTVVSVGQICNLGVENVTITGGIYVGGLVGCNYGTLTFCYATGAVAGIGINVGGLVGYNKGSLTSCYATGSVSGNNGVGGLVGVNDYGSLTSCYATGLVNGDFIVGGLVGGNWGSSAACFWNTQTSGKTIGVGHGTSTGVTGKTTAEMMMLSTFTDAGWDFSATDGDAADWRMLRENEDYPRLAWQEVFAGDIAGLYGVDGDDLMEVVNHWLEQGCPSGCEQADMDGSGAVDLGDFVIFSGEWMEGS